MQMSKQPFELLYVCKYCRRLLLYKWKIFRWILNITICLIWITLNFLRVNFYFWEWIMINNKIKLTRGTRPATTATDASYTSTTPNKCSRWEIVQHNPQDHQPARTQSINSHSYAECFENTRISGGSFNFTFHVAENSLISQSQSSSQCVYIIKRCRQSVIFSDSDED